MVKKLLAASLFAFALMAFINTQASSQSMYFCEDVDSDGYPISESSTFNIGSNGGYLKVLLRLPYGINSYTAKYVIYRNGDYDIYAYDGNDNLLTSGYLRINMR